MEELSFKIEKLINLLLIINHISKFIIKPRINEKGEGRSSFVLVEDHDSHCSV